MQGKVDTDTDTAQGKVDTDTAQGKVDTATATATDTVDIVVMLTVI